MLFGHQSPPILSYCFLNGSSLVTVFMQDSAPCSAHRARATQEDLQAVFDFRVEKTSGSTAAVTKQDRPNSAYFQLNTLVKANDSFVFFCILTCNTTLLSISVKVSNINVDFCVHINKCYYKTA